MSRTRAGRRPANRVHVNGANGVHTNGVNNRVAGLPPAPSEAEVDGKAPKPAPAPKPADGRTDGGRFGPGNKYGKGNPFSRKLGAMRSAFLNAVTEADVAAVARSLLTKTLAGDVEAARLFLSYAVGKPAPSWTRTRWTSASSASFSATPPTCAQQAIMEGVRARRTWRV